MVSCLVSPISGSAFVPVNVREGSDSRRWHRVFPGGKLKTEMEKGARWNCFGLFDDLLLLPSFDGIKV